MRDIVASKIELKRFAPRRSGSGIIMSTQKKRKRKKRKNPPPLPHRL